MKVNSNGLLYSSQLRECGGQEAKALGASPSISPDTWNNAGPGKWLGEKKALYALNVRSYRTLRQGVPTRE